MPPKPFELEWKLSCGHRLPMLEHEVENAVPGKWPERPRICPTCGKPRAITGLEGTAVDPED